MESSSKLEQTNTNFSAASTCAPSELPRERKFASSQYQSADTSGEHVTLRVDFKWGKLKSLITDVTKPSEPLYIVKYKMFSPKQFIYISADTKEVIGIGATHMISIDADYECRGRRDTLVAQKRFATLYTHRSGIFKDSEGRPAVMSWKGDISLKTWDFVCVDEQQTPQAKFSANLWGIKKIGKIELLGPLAHDQAFRDEMTIVGMTLAYTMIVRLNNIFSLIGSIFGDPAHDKKYKSEALPGQSSSARDSDDSLSSKATTTAPVHPLSREAQSDVKLKQ